MHYPIDKKIEVIELYKKCKSIREISKNLNLNYPTVWRWIKKYNEKGFEGIKRKEVDKNPLIFKYIFEFKQKNPDATLKEIQKNLKKDRGISLSLKKIWKILKYQGFSGFNKNSTDSLFSDCTPSTKETKDYIKIAEHLFKNGNIKECARILNLMPFCPENEMLTQIPDKYLNLERKIDRLLSLYGKIPYSKLARKAEFLRKKALSSSRIYDSIRLGVLEVKCLEWTYDAENIIRVGKEIERQIKRNLKDKRLLFELFIGMGKAYAILNDYKKAIEYANKCEKILKNLKYGDIYRTGLASLYTYLEDNRRAWRCVKKIERDVFYYTPLIVYAVSGDFKQVDKLIRYAGDKEIGVSSGIFLSRAIKFLARGNLKKVEHYAKESLAKAKRFELPGYIYSLNLIFAAIYSAMGMEKEKEKILEKALKFVKKQKMTHYENLLKPILEEKISDCMEKNRFPRIRLYCFLKKASLSLKKDDIKKLFSFAKKQKMLGILCRDILLFPEIIRKAIQYRIEIPFNRKFLQLPCFNENIPSLQIKFLGSLRVYKRGKEIKVKLTPKEKSFLIFLSLNSQKIISKIKIIENYWEHKKNPDQYLYNMLFNLRKKLGISPYLLYLKKNYLYNKIIFYTDWDEFQNRIVNAHALLKMGEKGFARRVFLDAFKLIRGKPFERMYDRLSEDMRDKIMAVIREEIENYEKNFGSFKIEKFCKLFF